METFAQFVVSGIVLGAVYAVAASGLVVTYTTSGIFNFAHGAFGMFGAYFYWQMVVDWGWPKVPALIVLLGIVAPLFGALIERVIMRGVEGVSAVTRLVVSISLLVGLLQLAQVIWTSEVGRTGPEFFEGERFTVVGYGVSYHEGITIIVALLIALGLRLLLYRTRLGIAMRSVVDDRSLASLTGARPDLTAMASWALGAVLAAVAGVLLAGGSSLDHLALTLLVINAYAAAIFGRLRSLPLTFVGALVLGLIDSFILVYSGDVLDTFGWEADWIATSFRTVVPVLVLFGVLLLIRPSQLRSLGSTPSREMVPKPTLMKILRWGGVMILVAVALGLWLESVDALWGTQDLDDLIRGVGVSIIMLSLVPLTGYGGQISLAQMTFAGIGGVSMAYWGGDNQLLALLAGVGLATVVGAMVSLPALRLRGIYLALATMAFAVFMESFVFQELPLLASGSARVEPLSIPIFSLESDTSTLVFLSVVFVLMALFVVYLRRSPFGRRLQAMKDSEAASATIGMSLVTTKLAVFSLSAGMAGLGGALYYSSIKTVGTTDVAMINSLIVMLMAVVGGISSVGGVLFGGMALGMFDIISTHIPALTDFFKVAPGLVGISLGRNPNGAVNEIARNLRERGDTDAAGDGEDDLDLSTLGVDRPFTEADIEVLDRTLDLAEEADRAVTSAGAAFMSATSDQVAGLDLRGVTVRFGGHTAVDAVDLEAPVGRLTGLIGPNGAGKTTTFNAICGMESVARGSVHFDGRDITGLSTHRRARAGIARTFQRLEVFGSLTAAENVQVAAEMRRAWQKDRSDPQYEVETLLERVGASEIADERCDGLPTGQARLVELARALACHPRLLLLDEPASGLTEAETHAFGRLLTELVAEGTGVLLVEHDVALVMEVCEYIYVLDFGAVLAEGATREIQADAAVQRAYLGTMA